MTPKPESSVHEPYVTIPVWVLNSGISGQALKLYAFLASLRPRDDGAVHLQQIKIAEWFGIARAAQVSKYADELMAAGALEITQEAYAGSMRRRNVYRVIRQRPRPPES